MQNINVGDYVKHREIILNGGLRMSIVDISETKAKVSFFDEKGIHKEEWFDLTDLILIDKTDGGFIEMK